jgi:hypothetical protein
MQWAEGASTSPALAWISGWLAGLFYLVRLVGLQIFGVWYVPDVDDELVAVSRENRDRDSQWRSRLVKARTEDLEDSGIVSQLEK